MIIVLGAAVGRPDTVDALREGALAHTRRSRTEPGCISHDVAVDAENPLRLLFTERWEDQAALDAHFAAPGSLEFVGSLKDLVAGRPEMSVHPV